MQIFFSKCAGYNKYSREKISSQILFKLII